MCWTIHLKLSVISSAIVLGGAMGSIISIPADGVQTDSSTSIDSDHSREETMDEVLAPTHPVSNSSSNTSTNALD
jgi:hypothetical protein